MNVTSMKKFGVDLVLKWHASRCFSLSRRAAGNKMPLSA
ncbi:hypothetical protein ACZ87_03061 [Candidatus Erwinia dacicola]|uniref:Uncharacterized protein n=1 Tax=Candidatus Erwinia dacicola TaxID=252393 RepID=A0A328THQ8_9GAMM|nr:hypothetical protein ACZ87_03061 [Candidatus Erwinia dacicola]